MLTEASAMIIEGRIDEATDRIMRCLAFCPGDPDVGEKQVLALDKANAKAQADQVFNELVQYYSETIKQFPRSSLHHNNFAWVCTSSKRALSAALRHSLKAVGLRPNNSGYLDTLADVYFSLGDREKAIEAARRCIQINPAKIHYEKQLKRFLGK